MTSGVDQLKGKYSQVKKQKMTGLEQKSCFRIEGASLTYLKVEPGRERKALTRKHSTCLKTVKSART